jgi:hypothetical protein
MGIQVIGGVSGAVADVGVAAALPLHVVIKPLPYGALGHYRVARRLVPAATTTAGNLWTLRNPTASGILVVVKRISLRAVQIAAPTAAVEDIFTLKIARAYTVADTTGSASIAPASGMQDVRTSMANAAAQVRESNAAGGASGGTKTVDTDAIATGSVWVSAALASGQGNGPAQILDYYPNVSDGEHPVVLASDEGILLANTNAFGTASGIALHCEIYWAEVTLY